MITSELIANTATEECTSAILETIGMDAPADGDVSYMVFETKYADKQFYICWAGGQLVGKEIELTAVGVGAIEALSRGLAVVSTKGSGTSDFSEEQGVATCSQSDASIAEGIRWALDLSPDERNQFRDHIVQFDSTYLQKSLKKAYQFSS